jgi:hypothetical protein
MILMALVLAPICILASWHDVPEGGKREKNYFALMLVLVTFMVGVFADNRGVDGGVGGLAALVGGTSSRLRRLQNGFARSYALTMLAGVVAFLGALWVIQ